MINLMISTGDLKVVPMLVVSVDYTRTDLTILDLKMFSAHVQRNLAEKQLSHV